MIDFTLVFLSIATVIVLFILTPIVIKKTQDNGFPLGNVITSSDQIIKILQPLIESLNIAPQTKDVLNTIVQSASIAVKYAEQLYLSGQLEKDKRKEEAINFVKLVLKDADIEIDDDRELLIVSIIESAVFLLPKTSEQK